MKTITLFESKLRISIPEDFYPVQESEAALMFPYRERPQYIYASDALSRFLTFSLLEKPLRAGETMNAAKELRKLVWSLNPSSMLSQAHPFGFGNLRCSGFSFRTGSKDIQVYNTMLAVSFEGRLLLCTYGCRMDDEEGKVLLRRLIADVEYIEVKERVMGRKNNFRNSSLEC